MRSPAKVCVCLDALLCNLLKPWCWNNFNHKQYDS